MKIRSIDMLLLLPLIAGKDCLVSSFAGFGNGGSSKSTHYISGGVQTGSLLSRNVPHSSRPQVPGFLNEQGAASSTRSSLLASASPSSTSTSEEELVLAEGPYLDAKQLEFACGYLNSKHPEVIRLLVIAFTELGVTMKKKNAFSGGSYVVESATLTNIDQDKLSIEATVQIRGEKAPRIEQVTVGLGKSLTYNKERLNLAQARFGRVSYCDISCCCLCCTVS
jgi:hypothetical protein